ncbi:unnamed protein product [Parascedosporium putredinis]|uniref:FAD-binding PCMH-type domain-containing protein n=1 Tax=Parascedosporium putredinis TaxID=1442378 RepID=A0A9P1M907_9PEZI|nr:unnamed protein product [Parascedosporium putredinis]CAI7991107.1 unnamed protein product [Parascedosporium putredinis]
MGGTGLVDGSGKPFLYLANLTIPRDSNKVSVAMPSLAKALLLALPLANYVAAQTIVIDGEEIAADSVSVAPAAERVVDAEEATALQLTDDILANLTSLELSNVTLFAFADESEGTAVTRRSHCKRTFGKCKTFPGDFLWPTKLVWKVFDLLTGGAVIESVPIGAVCYKDNAHYDAAACQELLDHWTESATHAKDPTSVMSPLYQGQTCLPKTPSPAPAPSAAPSYAVKISNVAQIQLAINFARNLNLRLVVHNTGHDFLGKSTGAGALSIWTHNLKDIQYIKSYKTASYSGAAFKLGAGVQVGELYAAANKYGVTAVGGECKVLSVDIVLPSGRFITADEKNNKDIFWAVRGGGGGTFGVVTSMTVKAHPKTKFGGLTFSITAGPSTNISTEVFWLAVEAYWRKFPEFAALGNYGYSSIFSLGAGSFMWSMNPWMIPGYSLAQFKQFFEHDNLYDTWSTHFPTETVGNTNLHTASRLFPKSNWATEAKRNETFATLRSVVEEGSALIQYNMNPKAPAGTPDSAANPAWREAIMFGIFGSGWAPTSTTQEVAAINTKITHDWMERLRQITPGSGGYGNEGDVMEPDFAQAFFGSNYDRLLSIKRSVDPWDLFYAPTAVGSESWYVTDQESWLTTQTGRLCRKTVRTIFEPDDYLMLLAIIPYAAEVSLAYAVGASAQGLTNSGMTPEARLRCNRKAKSTNGDTDGRLGDNGLPEYRNRLRIGIGILIFTYILLILLISLGCMPVKKNWQIHPDPGNSCQPAMSHLKIFITLVLNILTDIYLIMIPIPLLWSARLPTMKKIGLCILFSGAIFVMTAGLLRCVLILKNPVSGPRQGSAWAIRESFVAITASSIPIIWAALRRWIKRFSSSLRRSSSKNSNPKDWGNFILENHRQDGRSKTPRARSATDTLEMVPQARLTGDSAHDDKAGDSARWMEDATGPGNSHGWAV